MTFIALLYSPSSALHFAFSFYFFVIFFLPKQLFLVYCPVIAGHHIFAMSNCPKGALWEYFAEWAAAGYCLGTALSGQLTSFYPIRDLISWNTPLCFKSKYEKISTNQNWVFIITLFVWKCLYDIETFSHFCRLWTDYECQHIWIVSVIKSYYPEPINI